MLDPRGRRRGAAETAACRHAGGPAGRGFAGQVLHLERTRPCFVARGRSTTWCSRGSRRFWPRGSYRSGFSRLPWIVDMWVRADEVARRRQRGRGTVASAYARWRQQGFVAGPAQEPGDLDRFDETMYQPFANARFGEAAATLDRATMRRALQRGTIVWVEQEGRPVAAQLLERCGSTLHTVSVGTCLDPAAAQATRGADRAEGGGERSGARDRVRVDRLRRLHAVAHGRCAAEQAPMGRRARPSRRPAPRRARDAGPVDARPPPPFWPWPRSAATGRPPLRSRPVDPGVTRQPKARVHRPRPAADRRRAAAGRVHEPRPGSARCPRERQRDPGPGRVAARRASGPGITRVRPQSVPG